MDNSEVPSDTCKNSFSVGEEERQDCQSLGQDVNRAVAWENHGFLAKFHPVLSDEPTAQCTGYPPMNWKCVPSQKSRHEYV